MNDFKKEFWESENRAEFLFAQGEPYWHLYTPGQYQQIIFATDEDFVYGMNLIARCALTSTEIRIYVHTLMNNHLHIILSGRKEACIGFFGRIRNHLITYFYKRERVVDLSGFHCSLAPIPDLRAMRNEIVYVARNGYLVRKECTPFTYLWGSGWAYFNDLRGDAPRIEYDKLTIREKRVLCKSKDIELPKGVKICKGMIDPLCYVSISEGESFFREAHHYFNLLSKNWEAYSEIARQIGENLMVTDQELYSAVVARSLREFNQKRLSLLTVEQKRKMAAIMREDFNASPRQISNILNIKEAQIGMLG